MPLFNPKDESLQQKFANLRSDEKVQLRRDFMSTFGLKPEQLNDLDKIDPRTQQFMATAIDNVVADRHDDVGF